MYINVEDLLEFLVCDFRWPLHVDPGRRSGKAEGAIQCALLHATKVNRHALYVAPNRNALRMLEQKWSSQENLIKFTTYHKLEDYLRGQRFSCIMLDEPSLTYKSNSANMAKKISSLIQCPVIIFGN